MSSLFKLLFLIPIIIFGCKTKVINNKEVIQSINSLNMNMYLSNEEIPRNRMYHPVKCEEELHLESLTPCLMKNDENKTDFFINGCLRELWMLIPRSNRTLQLQFLNLSLSKSKNTKKSSSINNRSLYGNYITNANVNTNAQEMKMKIKRITDYKNKNI